MNMNRKITIGCLLLLVGTNVFIYGTVRYATTLRLTEAAQSSAQKLFWGDDAPVSVFKHDELYWPVNRLIFHDLSCLGEENCWGVEALAVCFIGMLAVFFGILLIRMAILKGCALVDGKDVRRKAFMVSVFRGTVFLCFALVIMMVVANSTVWLSLSWGGEFSPRHADGRAHVRPCTHLVVAWRNSFPDISLLDRVLYMRMLESGKTRWRWLWEFPVDWCLALGFLVLFFWALYLPFIQIRRYDVPVLELICKSTQADLIENDLLDVNRKQNIDCGLSSLVFHP